MIKYKLTDQNLQTHEGFQWEIGKWVKAKGKLKQNLCSDGWLHCYDSPLLAALHNPIHANINNPKLWEVEVGGRCKNDKGLKCGYRKMQLIREIPIPIISMNQRIAYGILCAKEVVTDKAWNIWADDWLSRRNRTVAAAYAAARAAYDADDAYAAAHAAADVAYAAADAAYAAEAAYAAAHAAYDAYAAYAACAAYAAVTTTAATATAAAVTARASIKPINFVKLAKQAIKFERMRKC